MNMTPEQDKALEKVRKLLQRAEDKRGSSDNEREMAMRQAHAMLAKHNLSMAQAKETGADGEGKREKRVDDGFEMRSLAWARLISRGVAELFFCSFFYVRMRSGNDKHFFVGRVSNVVTAMEIAQFVIKSVLSERDRRAKTEGAHDPNPWKLAFAQGAALTIYSRCIKMKRDVETQDMVVQEEVQGSGFLLPEKREPGTALVLASHYQQERDANSAYIEDKLGLKLRTSKGKGRSNRGTGDAYRSGSEFGKNVSLHRQLKNN